MRSFVLVRALLLAVACDTHSQRRSPRRAQVSAKSPHAALPRASLTWRHVSPRLS